MSSHTHIIAPKTITPDLETFAQCLERYDKSEQELPDKAKSAKLAFQSHFPALCTLVDRHATQNKEHGKVYDKMKQHIICMTVILTMLRQKHNDLMGLFVDIGEVVVDIGEQYAFHLKQCEQARKTFRAHVKKRKRKQPPRNAKRVKQTYMCGICRENSPMRGKQCHLCHATFCVKCLSKQATITKDDRCAVCREVATYDAL